jgi:hypothetical protein
MDCRGHECWFPGMNGRITMNRHFEEQLITSLRCEMQDGDLLVMPPDLAYRLTPVAVADSRPSARYRFSNRAGCVN